MAARKSRRVSRRQAVVALGAGLVGGTIGVSASQQPAKPPGKAPTGPPSKAPTEPGTIHSKCKNKRTSVVFLRPKTSSTPTVPPLQLQLASCCEYVRQVMNAGYNTQVDAEIKDQLREFITTLAQQHGSNLLLDYCFVQFDVKEQQLQRVRDAVAIAMKE